MQEHHTTETAMAGALRAAGVDPGLLKLRELARKALARNHNNVDSGTRGLLKELIKVENGDALRALARLYVSIEAEERQLEIAAEKKPRTETKDTAEPTTGDPLHPPAGYHGVTPAAGFVRKNPTRPGQESEASRQGRAATAMELADKIYFRFPGFEGDARKLSFGLIKARLDANDKARPVYVAVLAHQAPHQDDTVTLGEALSRADYEAAMKLLAT